MIECHIQYQLFWLELSLLINWLTHSHYVATNIANNALVIFGMYWLTVTVDRSGVCVISWLYRKLAYQLYSNTTGLASRVDSQSVSRWVGGMASQGGTCHPSTSQHWLAPGLTRLCANSEPVHSLILSTCWKCLLWLAINFMVIKLNDIIIL